MRWIEMSLRVPTFENFTSLFFDLSSCRLFVWAVSKRFIVFKNLWFLLMMAPASEMELFLNHRLCKIIFWEIYPCQVWQGVTKVDVKPEPGVKLNPMSCIADMVAKSGKLKWD